MEVNDVPRYSYDDYENEDVFDFRTRVFNGKPLPLEWKLPKHTLDHPKRKLLDFTMGYTEAPFVSERSKSALEWLDKAVQFVPIGKIKDVPYFLLNVVKVVDCLDRGSSELSFDPDAPGEVCSVRKFVFKSVALQSPIFKVPEDSGRIFVNDSFVSAVRRARLTGVGFEDPADLRFLSIHKAFPEFPYL